MRRKKFKSSEFKFKQFKPRRNKAKQPRSGELLSQLTAASGALSLRRHSGHKSKQFMPIYFHIHILTQSLTSASHTKNLTWTVIFPVCPVNHRRFAPTASTLVTTKQNNMAAAGATSRQGASQLAEVSLCVKNKYIFANFKTSQFEVLVPSETISNMQTELIKRTLPYSRLKNSR